MAKDDELIFAALGIGVGWGVAERAGVEKFLKRNKISPESMDRLLKLYAKMVRNESDIGKGLKGFNLEFLIPDHIFRRYHRTRVLYIHSFYEEAIPSGCTLLEMMFKDKLKQVEGFKPKEGLAYLSNLALKEKIIIEKENHFISGFRLARNETVHEGEGQEKADAAYLIKTIERVISKLYL